MKNINQHLIYPLFCLFPIIFMVSLMTSRPSYWYMSTVIYLVTFSVVLLLESKLPWNYEWNLPRGDLRLDLQHLVSNLLISAVALFSYHSIFNWRDAFGVIGLSETSLWPQYLVGLLIFDCGLYFVHRFSHINKWLWRLHAIHHSSERIYSVNGQKRHVLHEILEGLPGLLILFALGIRPEVTLAIIYTVNIHLLFQHGNISYRVGWLTKIFSVAELHRWHHQRDWKDVQGNYGAIFSFWDLMFGTSLKQEGLPSTHVGLSEPVNLVHMGYVQQHRWPFTSSPKTSS